MLLFSILHPLAEEKYGINDTRQPDGYPPKEGVKGYIVTDDHESPNQFLYFQHDRNTDEFTISRMSGYKIDEDEASRAGMRKGRSGSEAGVMVYMTDGNYTPTPISMDGLKRIIDHVMGGLGREAKAQSDFYADRKGSSGTIDEIKETIKFIKENNPEFTTEEIAAELKEIKRLGEQLEETMCKRGKNYIAARKRAGEKSSAYLSGRGVKVCKGQIKGSDGKKKKSY